MLTLVGDDGYYLEISITIDGWPWNLADGAPLQRGFPLAEQLLRAWDIPEIERVLV